MSTLTIAIDLAKDVSKSPSPDARARSGNESASAGRSSRRSGPRDPPCRVVMEVCASAHFWARFLIARGFTVVLRPPTT